MPVCTKTRLSLAALLLMLALPAAADFKVTDVQPRFEAGTLVLNGSMDLGLSAKVEEALSKGIQLEVVVDVRLYRQRWFVWRQGAGTWTLRRRIWYHALSGQYLVSAADTEPQGRESYLTLQEALKALGTLDNLRLPLATEPAPGGDYAVELRASLDIEALPSPLRPVAYTSLAWRLNSGWSTWKFVP